MGEAQQNPGRHCRLGNRCKSSTANLGLGGARKAPSQHIPRNDKHTCTTGMVSVQSHSQPTRLSHRDPCERWGNLPNPSQPMNPRSLTIREPKRLGYQAHNVVSDLDSMIYHRPSDGWRSQRSRDATVAEFFALGVEQLNLRLRVIPTKHPHNCWLERRIPTREAVRSPGHRNGGFMLFVFLPSYKF
jgi:hypothetical protein